MGSKHPERYFIEAAWVSVLAFAIASGIGYAQPTDSLSLAQALDRGRNHPALEAQRLEVQARKSLLNQASLYSNPRLSIEAENFAGTGPLSGVQGLETTARLEQTVELGGKRGLRRTQVEAELHLAEGELSMRQRETSNLIQDAFIQCLWLQEKMRAVADKTRAMEEDARLAERRQAAGRGSPAEALKMRVELSLARLEATLLEGDAASARMRLSQVMGESRSNFTAVRGDFEKLDSLPPWEEIQKNLRRHPELTRWETEQRLRQASHKLARAEIIPDLDFNAGFRQQRASGHGEYAWVGGVSIPLPVWNRNQGGIEAAAYRVSGGEKETKAATQEVENRARTLWNGLNVRSSEIELFKTTVLPDAQAAHEAARQAYTAGRFGSLELVEGQKLLFELNDRYLQAIAAYHRDFAELDALAGSTESFDAKETP
jgi:cobalt-zinc-cadmium efflux system outer membrane protein